MYPKSLVKTFSRKGCLSIGFCIWKARNLENPLGRTLFNKISALHHIGVQTLFNKFSTLRHIGVSADDDLYGKKCQMDWWHILGLGPSV